MDKGKGKGKGKTRQQIEYETAMWELRLEDERKGKGKDKGKGKTIHFLSHGFLWELTDKGKGKGKHAPWESIESKSRSIEFYRKSKTESKPIEYRTYRIQESNTDDNFLLRGSEALLQSIADAAVAESQDSSQ